MTISIITVNLNNYEGLERTIKSVEAQTYKDFEWIVVDGGSTDGSRELIEEHASRITKWVSEPDSGIYNAMNKGTRMSAGDYLLFLNSGDSLASNDVLSLVSGEMYKDHFHSDFYIGTENIVDRDGTILALRDATNTIHSFMSMYIGSIPHQATFISHRKLEQYPYNESYRIVSDWVFFLQTIGLQKSSVKLLPIIVSNFDSSGIGSSPTASHLEERERAFKNEIAPCIVNDYNILTPYRNEYYRIRWFMQHRCAYKIYRFLAAVGMRIWP